MMQNRCRISNRQLELDLLRIIAMFAVIIVHICGMETHDLPFDDSNWQLLTFIAGLMTWQIPIFVMISGRFFLDPERKVTISRVKSAILRLCIAFIVWNVIYQLFYIVTGVYSSLNWRGIIEQAIRGPYHFWYIYMLIGVYLLIPLLRKITENKKLMEYFIILFLIFEFLNNYMVMFPVVGNMLESVLKFINFHFALGYAGYFVAGYYFYKYPISKRIESVFYVLGIVSLFMAAGLNVFNSIRIGTLDDRFTSYLMPNIAIEAFALYTFVIKKVSKINFNLHVAQIIEKVADYSFGIYCIHAIILSLIEYAGFSPIMVSPFVMVPLLVLLTVVISGSAIFLIRKIPVIGKKIT